MCDPNALDPQTERDDSGNHFSFNIRSSKHDVVIDKLGQMFDDENTSEETKMQIVDRMSDEANKSDKYFGSILTKVIVLGLVVLCLSVAEQSIKNSSY